ncbi:CPBP family intramembrane metalloprotease [Bacillus sp. NP157]|nr:CPBP family intramembrane metalloprotease [Bacillus sp. NP157]
MEAILHVARGVSLSPLAGGVLALLGVAVVSAVVFGLVHVYQGAMGVLATGLLGGVLCLLYVLTGSLLLPIVIHFIVNLRAAFLAKATEEE